jgi:hypothetical protein
VGEWRIGAAFQEVDMNVRNTSLACLAFACALSLGYARPLIAQEGAQAAYDSQNWQAPRGYDQAYPENGTPNMVARQGYSSGFNEGLADASRGKKFEPTDNRAYGKAIIPKGMNKDEFRQQYREAFVKGYTNAYKGDAH